MTRSRKPQYLFLSSHALDLGNRANILTEGASGVPLMWVAEDQDFARFSNATLDKHWDTVQAVRKITCFYAGMLDGLVEHGAPLNTTVRERLTYIREAIATPRKDQLLTRTMEINYDQGRDWAMDYMDEIKESPG